MKAIWVAMVVSLLFGVVYAAPKINLNKADVSTLTQSFKGIGKRRAEAIVKYRETHGLFKSVTDLAYVRGLGHVFVTKQLAKLEAVYDIR